MHLVFGFGLDGHPYPGHPGPERGAVGAAAVGPAGLLDVLATRLGLGMPQVAAVVRVAAWLSKLGLAASTGPRFWSASLAVAPWASARTLLAMRDGLVEAGWSPAIRTAAPRLIDLEAAETAGRPLPAGRADLMREVVEAVRSRQRIPNLALVEVVDAVEHLPPCWRRLLDGLRVAGVEVRPFRRTDASRPSDDLSRLSAHLNDGRWVELAGDGSFTMMRAPQALTAAEGLADWLAADECGEQAVVIAEEGDTHLLDSALRRRGLPILGLSPGDRHRGALQALPLAFEAMLAPPDPQAVLDLLALPVLPLPGWAARGLSAALLRQPGFEGQAWRDAWEVIGSRLSSNLGEVSGRGRLDEWRSWLAVGAHDGCRQIDLEDALRFCARVAAWAAAEGEDPTFAAMAAAVGGLEAALVALGRPSVGVDVMRSMIDAALGDGVPDPTCRAEAGPLRGVADPAAFWGEAATLVWWRFAARPEVRPMAWRSAERGALADAGVPLEDPLLPARRAEAAWTRAFAGARTRLVIVAPAADRGAPLTAHPFAQRFAPLLERGNAGRIVADLGALAGAPRTRIAGRDLVRQAASPLRLPQARTRWAVPPRVARRAADRTESASSLSDLVSCELRWLLRHVVALRPPEDLSLPAGERLVGDVAHALARLVFPLGVRLDPARIRADAVARFGEAVAMVAAPLARPGRAAEMASAKRTIAASLARLASLVDDASFTVEGIEVWRAGLLDGIEVRSRLDLVLRHAQGAVAVVDLKWTSDDAARRIEVEDGGALQLATYARLVGSDVAAGYYLVRSQRFLAAAPMPIAAEPVDPAMTLAQTWGALAADRSALASRLGAGEVLARGVAGGADHAPLASAPPSNPCRLCGFDALCRVDGDGVPR